jgi:hypothetical protein
MQVQHRPGSTAIDAYQPLQGRRQRVMGRLHGTLLNCCGDQAQSSLCNSVQLDQGAFGQLEF